MKKLIKRLFTAMLFITLANAEVRVETTGNMEFSTVKHKAKYLNMFEVNVNNDFYIRDDWKIGTSVGLFLNDRPVFNNNIKEYSDEVHMYRINELYLTKYLGDGLNVSVGAFPFRKGRFYEHGFNGHKTGIGIYTLTDLTMQGGIVTHIKDNHTFQVGSVKYDEHFKTYKDIEETRTELSYKTAAGSGMDYVTYKYEDSNWYSEIMLTQMKQFSKGVKIMDTNTATLALSYDDEIDSGRTYYGLTTYSVTDGDTSSLSPLGFPIQTNLGHYDKFESEGYFILAGIKQELDSVIFNRDIFLGMEYMYRSEGYHSLLFGKPLTWDAYSDVGESYNSYAGIRLSKDMSIKLRWYRYDGGGRITKGTLGTPTTDTPERLKSLDKYNVYTIHFYIDF